MAYFLKHTLWDGDLDLDCVLYCLKQSSVAVQPGLCQTRSETPKTGFLTRRLIRFLPSELQCGLLVFSSFFPHNKKLMHVIHTCTNVIYLH